MSLCLVQVVALRRRQLPVGGSPAIRGLRRQFSLGAIKFVGKRRRDVSRLGPVPVAGVGEDVMAQAI